MSYADFVFINNCRNILRTGTTDTDFDVRPKWLDGTPAHTVMLTNVCNRYNLGPGHVPVMTMRKVGFEKAVDEILWIFQRQSNNVQDLSSHIWDSWAAKSGDDVGSIGKTYGYQIGKKYRHHKATKGEDLSEYPSAEVQGDWVLLSQIDGVIWDLKNNPTSRSIMTNMFNHEDLADMHLRPCAYSLTFNVTIDKDGKKVLNTLLNQRSQDTLTANNWNVVQYSVLVHMIAQVCGMVPGQFTHMIANMHIYDRHVPVVREMIHQYGEIVRNRADMYMDYMYMAAPLTSSAVTDARMYSEIPYPNPKFWINPDVKNFHDFKVSDFELVDYKYLPFDQKIEVAV